MSSHSAESGGTQTLPVAAPAAGVSRALWVDSWRSGWSWLLRLAPWAALGLFILAAVRAGLPAADAGRALVAVGVTQTLPGLVIWRMVRPVDGSWFEDIVLGTAVGVCLAMAVQTAAVTFGVPWLVVAGGPLVAVALLAIPGTRRRIIAARTTRWPAAWSAAVAAVALLLIKPAQVFYRTVPMSWPEGFRATYVDMPFHLALAAQLAERGPGEVPYVLGEPLKYHWFSHAWVAQVSQAAGVPLDAVLLRFLPAMISVLAVFAVACAAVRLGRWAWAGPLAALIAVAAADFDVFRGTVGGTKAEGLVNHLSPTLALSTLIVMALVTLFVFRWRSQAGPGSAVLVVLLAFAAVGTKGSSLPVVVAGLALAAAVAWLFRWPARRAITIDLVLVTGSLLASMVLVQGGAGQLELGLEAGLSQSGVSGAVMGAVGDPGFSIMLLAGVILVVGVMARGAGLLAGITGSLRNDPAVPLLLGAGLAGAGAVVLMSHPGHSQWYFARSAVPLLAIGSAIGLVALWKGLEHHHRERVFWIAIVTGLLVLVVQVFAFRDPPIDQIDVIEVALVRLLVLAAIIALGATAAAISSTSTPKVASVTAVVSVALIIAVTAPTVLRQFSTPLPAYNAQVIPGTPFSFSSDQIEAAQWLRDHTHPDDVVATNRHCAAPDSERCDSRSFSVTAYTQRRVLVEGWAYTARNDSPDPNVRRVHQPFWDPELLAHNDTFLQTPTAAGAQTLADHGVTWLYIDKTRPYSHNLATFATPRHETEWAWILELDPHSP